MKPLTLHTVLITFSVIPTLLQDIINKADKWGNDGQSSRIDPFTEINHVSPFLYSSLRIDYEWTERTQFCLSSSFS